MQKNSKARVRTITLSAAMTAAMGLLAVSSSVPARASASADLQTREQFEIPSESLNAALTTFSAQSHIHVVTSGVPVDVVSPGVSGELSTINALTALLRDTGMSFRQIDTETIVVMPVPVAQLRPTHFQLVADGIQQDALADQPTAGAAPAAAAPTQLTEVQVTGTRIVREGYEAPTPVTAVGIQQLQDAANANVGETLTQLPVFQGSSTNTTTTLGDTEGTQTELNLRQLGANRTLILFDGRRLPAANTEFVPDVDLLPDALIQRVDVVTGGASAVYGSDAVAGVVNYVLDTNFTGIKGLVQGGVSGYGDGESEKISLTGGTNFFGGRLHLLLSGDQSYQAAIPGTARPWNTLSDTVMQNPAYITGSKVPQYIKEPCCVTKPGYYPGGIILSGPLIGTDFGVGGAVGLYTFGVGSVVPGSTTYGGSWQETNAPGTNDILGRDSTTHFFARVGFDVTPTIQAYAEFINGQDHSAAKCCPDYYPTGLGTVFTSNPYVPASVVTQAGAAGVSSFLLGTSLTFPGQGVEGGVGNIGDRTEDIYVIGLRGQLNIGKNSYNWNFYGQQGIAEENLLGGLEANNTNLVNAIQAVRVGSYGGSTSYTSISATTGSKTTTAAYTAANFPNPLGIAAGTVTCATNLLPLSNPAETNNCVPFNVFGIGVESQAAINYTQGYAWLRQVTSQNLIGADISGEPFSTWAGPVSLAADVEYRREATDGNSDPNSRLTNWFSVNYFAYDASEHVTEEALEAVVPLLKGVPGVQELDFNGGARATDYSVTGSVTTYKYGLEYTPINDFRFRATYSEDIRAPNLNNLFALSSGHSPVADPFFNNTQAPATTLTEGNPALDPEKAHQYEIGLVFQPTGFPGFNLSVDYYHINITGAIGTVGATFELQSCYATRIAGTNTGTSPYCGLITRNGDGTLNTVRVIPFNIASYFVSGVDYQADYRKQLTEIATSWKGAVDLHLSATNTQHVITNTGIPGPAQILDAAGTGSSPRWAIFGTLAYDLDAWRFVWMERYISSVGASNTLSGSSFGIVCSTNCPSPVPTGFATIGFVPTRPDYFLANMSVQYKFVEHDQQEADVFVSANNVFNKIPPANLRIPPYSPTVVNTDPTDYDPIGLYVHAGVRFRL